MSDSRFDRPQYPGARYDPAQSRYNGSDCSEYLRYFPERLNTGKTLWFVRDEMEVQAVDNAVALTSMEDDALAHCKDFFRQFPSVLIAIKDDENITAAGVAELLESSVDGLTILLPRQGAFGKCASLCEMRSRGINPDRVLYGAIERPAVGLLDLADVEYVRQADVPSIPSGIGPLDAITGGFRAGELSVWTGKRGSGKSTILGPILLESVDFGMPVCAYSGELVAWRFKSWVMQQAAGPDHVVSMYDELTGRNYYDVPPETAQKIDAWWRGKFFLYDNKIADANDENSIMSVFEYALHKHNCRIFMADNLMTVRFAQMGDKDYYRAQSRFVNRLSEFAKKHGVHVHLVAHPRKGNKIDDGDDVSGSGDIVNLADNAFAMERLSEKEIAENGFAAGLQVLKNREMGKIVKIMLDYDEPSRRFYKAGTTQNHKKYGWDI